MNNKQDKIEFPFGVKDSELIGFEYPIPDGFEAEIKDGKVIIRKKEDEDEKMRKWLIAYLENRVLNTGILEEKDSCKEAIAWLEKQGKQKSEWSEEDEKMLKGVIKAFETLAQGKMIIGGESASCFISWLRTLKDRILPQPKQDFIFVDAERVKDYLPPHWKPSEEMLEALSRVIPEDVFAMSEDEMLLDKLYQGLKYGRVLSKQ